MEDRSKQIEKEKGAVDQGRCSEEVFLDGKWPGRCSRLTLGSMLDEESLKCA